METPLVSSDHDGLASIGRKNVFGQTMVCLAGSDTYCRPPHLYCNCELIVRAGTMGLGAIMNVETTGARSAHNRATG